MACFIVPAVEAVATTVASKVIKHNVADVNVEVSEHKISFSRKLKWLSNLLWGGSALLAFEHIWHGEVVPFFPFLTAMADSATKSEMLYEMATTGVTMALLVTVVWAFMLVAVHFKESSEIKSLPQNK